MQYLGRLFLYGGADKAFEGLEIILVRGSTGGLTRSVNRDTLQLVPAKRDRFFCLVRFAVYGKDSDGNE